MVDIWSRQIFHLSALSVLLLSFTVFPSLLFRYKHQLNSASVMFATCCKSQVELIWSVELTQQNNNFDKSYNISNLFCLFHTYSFTFGRCMLKNCSVSWNHWKYSLYFHKEFLCIYRPQWDTHHLRGFIKLWVFFFLLNSNSKVLSLFIIEQISFFISAEPSTIIWR